MSATLLFGYRHVKDVPRCPCGDPGDYMMLEQPGDDPLTVRFRCWCGATMPATFDDDAERRRFLADNGVSEEGDGQ